MAVSRAPKQPKQPKQKREDGERINESKPHEKQDGQSCVQKKKWSGQAQQVDSRSGQGAKGAS